MTNTHTLHTINNKSVQKKSYNKILSLTLIVVCSLFSYNLGKVGRGDGIAYAQSGGSSSTLSQIKTLLDDKFVPWRSSSTMPTQTDFDNGIIKGYVNAYNDPYTTYFEPIESKIFHESVQGSFGGVGIQIAVKDNQVVVIAPVKGTPAEIAGIKSGDMVVKVDENSTDNLPIDKVVSMIRGEIGTKVKISILRSSSTEVKEYILERKKIEVPSTDTKIVDGVFVISLYNFSAESAEQFRQALIKFAQSTTTKLIIDLRGNPGGFLEASVNMASFFLPEGKIVVSEKRGKAAEEVNHRSKGFNVFSGKLKVVILVDQGSASASEILAGALKDHGVATIVGKKTFGKGSVQELIDLCDLEKGALLKVINNMSSSTEKCNKGSIKITVAKWYTPNGINISEAGVEPDVKVELDEALKFKGIDTQLMKAIQVAKYGIPASNTVKSTTIKKVSSNNQKSKVKATSTKIKK